MKKNKGLLVFYISIISVLVTALTLSATTALYQKGAKGNGFYGEIALRSYFERGHGTVNDPYVITRPRHMYNLSRLQGLGVFDKKKYFQLGFDPDENNGVAMCYVGETNTKVPYLDMSSTYSNYSTNPINAIGSEAIPFYGEFDGQNVEIRNLNVYASPEDAGLFGYTAHDSKVHNLFLSDIYINAMGYTDDYADLYAETSAITSAFRYKYLSNDVNTPDPIYFNYNTETEKFLRYYIEKDANDDFVYDEEASDSVPSISIIKDEDEYDGYQYISLLSGDLITFDNNGNVVPDIEHVVDFFNEKKNDLTNSFPLQASSSASIVVSKLDAFGIKHSKVVMAMQFDFTLDSESSTSISMNVHVANKHSNNIGLIIGHCDGTIQDCYVYNGGFKMNGVAGNNKIANGSNMGLIGLVGNTVQNSLANESDSASKSGTAIGVLDFTNLYNDIIDENSFAGIGEEDTNIQFVPRSTTKYANYLRYEKNQSTNEIEYFTQKKEVISLRGQQVLANTDLGVFTVVTDHATSGINEDKHFRNDKSTINKESQAINGNYYLYYTTGEYDKVEATKGGYDFDDYKSSYSSDSQKALFMGHHLPSKEQITDESFAYRNLHQNYNFRFQLNPSERSSAFYFADVDTDTIGGYYLAHYFNNRLVDRYNTPIAIGNGRCGVMLRDSRGNEVSQFASSFSNTDISSISGNVIYAFADSAGDYCTSNSINFAINTEYANVTVVASSSSTSEGSAVGVYKMDNNEFAQDGQYMKFNQSYKDPDYAFFMPQNKRLAYFDYKVNSSTHKGEVGTYVNNTFTPLSDVVTEATIANQSGEFAAPGSDQQRLFVHTFKLPQGRYCIQSPVGDSWGGAPAKIYYVCAQGQNEGELEFDDNVFSNDIVERVDFVKSRRFNDDGTPAITLTTPLSYDASGSELLNKRLYVLFVNSDRSTFDDSENNIYFSYKKIENIDKFFITTSLPEDITTATSPPSGDVYMALTNYYNSTLPNAINKKVMIHLFGGQGSYEQTITYTHTS